LDQLRRLLLRAALVGVSDQFTRSLADIETALKHEARSWGDPVRELQRIARDPVSADV
jgi:hypothetical protein